MDMDTLVRNLRILLKADMILAELHMRRLAAKSGLFFFALVIAAFGAVMLGLAGFFLLQQAYGTIIAAAICGGAALVIALVLVLIAASLKPGREAQVALEVHEAALQAVSRDMKAAGGQAQRYASMVSAPLQLLPGVILPLITTLLRMFRGRSTPES